MFFISISAGRITTRKCIVYCCQTNTTPIPLDMYPLFSGFAHNPSETSMFLQPVTSHPSQHAPHRKGARLLHQSTKDSGYTSIRGSFFWAQLMLASTPSGMAKHHPALLSLNIGRNLKPTAPEVINLSGFAYTRTRMEPHKHGIGTDKPHITFLFNFSYFDWVGYLLLYFSLNIKFQSLTFLFLIE